MDETEHFTCHFNWKNKHAPNVQFCIHPFPTPSLFWVQAWNVRIHGFLSQLAGLHPWPTSPVQTNILTEALLVFTLPHLANVFWGARLHKVGCNSKENCRKCSLSSGAFYFNVACEVLPDLDDFCPKMSNPSMGWLRFSIKLGIKQAFDQCRPFFFWCCHHCLFYYFTTGFLPASLSSQLTLIQRMGRMKSISSFVLNFVSVGYWPQ